MVLQVPEFKDLPIATAPLGTPKGAAWGVFDKNGEKDVQGTLNFLTPEVVKKASTEIKTGESTVLNLPMHMPPTAVPGRVQLKHTVKSHLPKFYGCDDEVEFNTQCSSQWDGFMHFAHQESKKFYNGVTWEEAAEKKSDDTLGIDLVSRRGGIVGRGILLDFVRYAERHGIEYDVNSNYGIPLSILKDIIKEQKLIIRQGDILFVRSGLSKWLHDVDLETAKGLRKDVRIGVEASDEILEWLWNSQFSAIGGDAAAFEARPHPSGRLLHIHKVLPLFGMMISEYLDLEGCAQLCEKHQRWSFFVSSTPIYVQGGIASPANMLAVF